MKKTKTELALAYLRKARTMSQYASLDDLLKADQSERATLITALELDIAQAVEPVEIQLRVGKHGTWRKTDGGNEKARRLIRENPGVYESRELFARPAAPKEPAAPNVNTGLLAALELFMENVDKPPEPNCSCHLSPPCGDCVDHSGLREAFALADDAIARAEGAE